MRALASSARWVACAVIVISLTAAALFAVLSASPPESAPAPKPIVAAAFSLTENGITPAAISLTWAESTESDFTNYTVFLSTQSSSGAWTPVWSTPTESAISHVVSNLQPGTTYWWLVTSYYTNEVLGGLLGGTPAETNSTVLEAAQPTVAYLTETTPTGEVTLNWTNNASYGGGLSFDYYVVKEDDVTEGVVSVAANISSESGNTTTLTGLESGTSYSFYVITYDACPSCESGPSESESNAVTYGAPASLVVSSWESQTETDTGLPIEFSCTPAGGSSPYSYAWNFTNGTGPPSAFPAGLGTMSWSYAGAATYTVTCQVTDHAGRIEYAAPLTVVVHPDVRVSASSSSVNVTVGTPVTLRCEGSEGTAPLTVHWAPGNGSTVPGTPGSDWLNTTVSYSDAGTYNAQCFVSDSAGDTAIAAVGIRVNAAVVPPVTPKPKSPWFTAEMVLESSVGVAAVLAVGTGLSRRRDEHAERTLAMSRWLPPAGPATTVRGAKTCPKCGASNLPIRRSCQACGAPLPRGPQP
jgi:hypothetical protein